jgi:hypothetical protein
MSKKQKTHSLESLESQMSAENTHKESSTLIEHIPVYGSPFHITKTEEGYFLRMGDYRLTALKESEDAVREALYEEDWNIIVNIVSAIMHARDRNEESVKNKQIAENEIKITEDKI